MVSRGLLGTQARGAAMFVAADPEDAADRAFDRLADAPAGDYAWRECAQWASRLYRGDGDERGRRLFTEAGRTDARYVARVSRRALRGDIPDTKLRWGLLRESLRRILRELAEGAA